MGEERVKRRPAPKFPLGMRQKTGFFNIRPRRFKKVRIRDTSRAGGFAGEASEAKRHLVGERAIDFKCPVGHRAHE